VFKGRDPDASKEEITDFLQAQARVVPDYYVECYKGYKNWASKEHLDKVRELVTTKDWPALHAFIDGSKVKYWHASTITGGEEGSI
jgi:hypothetical protein